MPEISHQQADALRALEWLLSDEAEDRRTGRSRILALAYLRMACRRPGTEWIRVWDHALSYGGRRSYEVLLRYINEIATEAGANVDLNLNEGMFRLIGSTNESERYLFEAFTENLDLQLGLTDEQLAERAVRERPQPVVRPRGNRPPHGTLREALLKYVYEYPGQSATQIAHALDIKPSTASAYLYEASQFGKLVRKQDGGPRGGMTYYPLPPPEPAVVGLSVWERLRKPEVG